jgi:D-alanine-D-alanine ligase-like ATP-grasp enzyme
MIWFARQVLLRLKTESRKMKLKTRILSGTNMLSSAPVVHVLGEAAFAADIANLATHAIRIQALIGAPGMQVLDPGLPPGQAAFECFSFEAAQDLAQLVARLAEMVGDETAFAQSLEEMTDRMSARWAACLSSNAGAAAMRLVLPWVWVSGRQHPLIAVGQGVHRRLFWGSFTPETAEVGVVFSTPKNIMGQMLYAAGLPVPPQGVATDLAAAERLATSIGLPVVVKPARMDHGIGITTGIQTLEELRAAFEVASAHGDVLVQKHVEGTGHRFLVHQGKLIAAVRQMAAHVVGDGRSTIAELIETTNATRTDKLSRNWKKIEINDLLHNMLARAALTLDSVPDAGQIVYLRSNTNVSQGGTLTRVTDDVHPANRIIAETAAAVFGLDLAGIDIHSTDITRPITETGGAVIEVNATPAWLMMEEGFELENSIVLHHFPEPNRGRVPIIACVEPTPDRAVAIVSARSSSEGLGVVTPAGVQIGGFGLSVPPDASIPLKLRTVLANPRTEMVVLSIPEKRLSATGLGTERISVAIAAPGAGRELLQCLDRSADAIIIAADDLDNLPPLDQRAAEIWCLTRHAKANTDPGVHLVVPAGAGEITVISGGGPAQTFTSETLGGPVPLALRLAAILSADEGMLD